MSDTAAIAPERPLFQITGLEFQSDTAAIAPERPLFQITGLEFRLWPIALAAGLMMAMLWPLREGARWLFKHHADWFHGQVWAFVGLAELLQIAIGLAAVVVLRRVLP